MDKKKIEAAVRMILEAIGEDPDREGLVATPGRIGRMCEEIFGGNDEEVKEHLSKTFSTPGSELVLEKDIPFYSMCEHHLLPFLGEVHIAYISDGKVVGLSKLARTVDAFAKRAQIQEKLTEQIADAVMENLQPKGVLVIIEAEHMCMSMRGIKKPGTKTMTYIARGVFEEDDTLCDRVFRMIKK